MRRPVFVLVLTCGCSADTDAGLDSTATAGETQSSSGSATTTADPSTVSSPSTASAGSSNESSTQDDDDGVSTAGDGSTSAGNEDPGCSEFEEPDPCLVLPLGTVTEQPDCQLPPNAPPGSECKVLTVSCDTAVDLDLQLIVSPPEDLQAERGTVVIGGGGTGQQFTNDELVNDLRALGFRTVNRAWMDPWETGPGGLAKAACRYATALTWIAEQSWQEGPLCATGNSGGASEITYALARFGREEVLRFAVPNGGPVMTRLDYACLGDPQWSIECAGSTPEGVCSEGSNQCEFAPDGAALIDLAYGDTTCSGGEPASAVQLLADSILSPYADLDYATALHFVFGTEDCTIAIPLGVLFAESVTSEVTIEIADGPHVITNTATGRAAIAGALDMGCVDP